MNTEAAHLMTIAEHREIEAEGERTPAQAANDSPPTELDCKVADLETLFAIKRANAYLSALTKRRADISHGVIQPMPELERPLPQWLRTKGLNT
jgi:hypothetical protein